MHYCRPTPPYALLGRNETKSETDCRKTTFTRHILLALFPDVHAELSRVSADAMREGLALALEIAYTGLTTCPVSGLALDRDGPYLLR